MTNYDPRSSDPYANPKKAQSYPNDEQREGAQLTSKIAGCGPAFFAVLAALIAGGILTVYGANGIFSGVPKTGIIINGVYGGEATPSPTSAPPKVVEQTTVVYDTPPPAVAVVPQEPVTQPNGCYTNADGGVTCHNSGSSTSSGGSGCSQTAQGALEQDLFGRLQVPANNMGPPNSGC